MKNQRFAILFHFISFNEISIGLHISLKAKNIEIHIPFGFLRIGMQSQVNLFNLCTAERINQNNLQILLNRSK